MTSAGKMIGAGVIAGLMAISLTGTPASAQQCLEQIVALQSRLPKPPQDAAAGGGPSAAQSVGAQLDRQPTPGSVAAAGGEGGPQVGAAGYLNKAQNLQAAGDERGCLQAVDEARKALDGK